MHITSMPLYIVMRSSLFAIAISTTWGTCTVWIFFQWKPIQLWIVLIWSAFDMKIKISLFNRAVLRLLLLNTQLIYNVLWVFPRVSVLATLHLALNLLHTHTTLHYTTPHCTALSNQLQKIWCIKKQSHRQWGSWLKFCLNFSCSTLCSAWSNSIFGGYLLVHPENWKTLNFPVDCTPKLCSHAIHTIFIIYASM